MLDDLASNENVRRAMERAEGIRDICTERLESNQLSTEDRKYFERELQNAENELEKGHRLLTETMRKSFSEHYGYEICGDHSTYDLGMMDMFCNLPVGHGGDHHHVVDVGGALTGQPNQPFIDADNPGTCDCYKCRKKRKSTPRNEIG